MTEPMIPDEESLFPRPAACPKDWRQKAEIRIEPKAEPKPEPKAPKAEPKPEPVAAVKKLPSASRLRTPTVADVKAAPKRSSVAKNVLRAAAVVGAIGGIALLAQDRRPTASIKPVVPVDQTAARAPQGPTTPVIALEKPALEKPALEKPAAPSAPSAVAATPVAKETRGDSAVSVKKKSLRELSKRSRHHEAIARILLQLDPNDATEDAALRIAYELSALGPPAVFALREMLEEIDNEGDRRVLGLALAGIRDDETAADAAGEALALVEDQPAQARILRQLPETASSNESIAAAFAVEKNGETRMLMLKEYARRIGMNPEEVGPDMPVAVSEFDVDAFLRTASADKDVAIRRETLRLVEERGAPRDMQLAEEIYKAAVDPTTKKAALMAYSATAGEAAIPLLAELSQSSDVKLRLEAVDAISRARCEAAFELMDKICKDDAEVRVKKHAQRLLVKMRDPS